MGWESRFEKKQENKTNSTKKSINNLIYNDDVVFKFLDDWESCRDRHSGQKEILKAFFEDKKQYIFIRAGRKFSKTTIDIDIVWRFAMEHPNSVIYMCYPTITQAIEVVWEEKRLQWCDLRSPDMFEKYITKTDDSKHILTFISGSYVKLIGTWSEARGRGTQPDLLIVDEIQDCSGDYLDAMDPNLAAKDGKCVMTGTPPKRLNHFNEWEERIARNPRGKTFKFSSFCNDRIPHLAEWLNDKKNELIRSNKEDVWLREYMAEDCFASADRILPDAIFKDSVDISKMSSLFNFANRYPILAVSVQNHYMCFIFAVLIPQKAIFIFDQQLFQQIWKKSFQEIYPELGVPLKELQDFCGKRLQNYVWDESESLKDVLTGFNPCREDIKWQDRGIPLLREMMNNKKIHFSDKIADFGLECQKYLRDESIKDVEKNYPFTCTLSMLVNEFFCMEKVVAQSQKEFDKYQGFREMGIPIPPKRSKHPKLKFFRMGD